MRALSRLVSAITIAAFGLSMTSIASAAAGNPGKTPIPTPPDIVTDACGPAVGPVLAHITVNREFTKTFVQQDGTVKITVNGASFAAFTRLSTGKTVSLNISGNGYIAIRPDGEVIAISRGPLVDVNPPGGGIWLYRGRVTFDPFTGLVFSSSGQVTDVCALLL